MWNGGATRGRGAGRGGMRRVDKNRDQRIMPSGEERAPVAAVQHSRWSASQPENRIVLWCSDCVWVSCLAGGRSPRIHNDCICFVLFTEP